MRMTIREGARLWPGPLLVATLLVEAAGCGWSRTPAAVDVDKALATVRSALETWQGGQPIERLKSESPSLTIVEPRWLAGYLLERFEVLPPPAPAGYDSRFTVRLWMKDGKGKSLHERAEYTVTTAPAVTMIRTAEGW